MNKDYIKHAELTPLTVLAGDSVELTIRLVVGKDFTAEGSRLVFDLPATLGFSRPSCYDQEDDGYMAVFCSNPDLLYTKKVWDIEQQTFGNRENAGFKGMAQRLFVLDFSAGRANEDDEIIVKWGFTRNGFGVGTKITTVVPLKEYYSVIHVRYFADGKRGLPDFGRSFRGFDRPVPDREWRLNLRILPREPERIRVLRQHREVKVLLLDRFANVCPVKSIAPYLKGRIKGDFNDHGVFRTKQVKGRITSRKLPFSEAPAMEAVYAGMNIYFGDLHVHSATSNDAIEREKMTMTPDLSYEFAKNVAGLDFLAVTDHHQPWDIERNKIGAGQWEKLLVAAAKHNQEGEFLAFTGFEFRCPRGDTAIILNEDFTYDEIDRPELKDIRALWEKFKGRDYLSIPHFHNPGSLGQDEWYACPDPDVEPVLEIYSCHGSYESGNVLERRIPQIKPFRPDRNAQYLLKKGYHYGLVCNSDGHKGNPGFNGLTAVYATELTKKAIFDAIRRRRVYGTTNARIKLLFTVNGQLMGSLLPQTGEKNFYVEVHGEGRLKAVDLIRNGELYKRYRPDGIEFRTELRIREEGKSFWYVRVTQLDNHIAYSSPVWFE